MPKHPNLHPRNGVWYYRRHVPLDIRETYGKPDIFKSLGTKDLNEAKRQAHIKNVEYDEKFANHRAAMAQEGGDITKLDTTISQACEARFQEIIDADFVYRSEIRAAAEADSDAFYRGDLIALPHGQRFYDLTQEPVPLAYMLAFVFKSDLKKRLTRVQSDIASGMYEVDGDPKLARGLLQAEVRAFEALISRDFPDDEPEKSIETASPQDDGAPMFSDASAAFIAERRKSGLPEKTVAARETTLRDFEEVCGDKPVSAYLKSDGAKIKDVLSKTPTHRRVKKEFRRLTIVKAAQRAAKMEDPQLLSTKSINEFMNIISTFFKWADDHNDADIRNPVSGLKIKEVVSVGEKRQPFSIAEIEKLFKAPVYLGCESIRRWREPGDLIPRDHSIYWLPLVGLLSGARLGELMQLTRDDIREKDGVRYISISTDKPWKSVKNQPSVRNIPIHPELVRLGFLDFVATKKARIFDDYDKKPAGWSDAFSKHFRRFADSVSVPGSFHRFRHGFEDACRNSGVPADQMDAIQGHAQSGMRATYGSGHGLKILNEAMNMVHYDGLDLSHLRP